MLFTYILKPIDDENDIDMWAIVWKLPTALAKWKEIMICAPT